MNDKGIQKKNRNKRRPKITGMNSTNEFLEKREQNNDDKNISYEEIKEKKNIKEQKNKEKTTNNKKPNILNKKQDKNRELTNLDDSNKNKTIMKNN